MVIPLAIWGFFYGIAFFVVVVIAWFAIVFTGRCQRGCTSSRPASRASRVASWLFVVAVAIWFYGVFAGRRAPGLMEAMRMPMAYYIRANAYFCLITEDWPPFDPGPNAASAPEPVAPLPMATA